MWFRLVAAYAAGALALPPAAAWQLVAAALLVLAALSSRRGRRLRLACGWIPACVLAVGFGFLVRHGERRAAASQTEDVVAEGWIASRPEPGRRGASAWFVLERVHGSPATGAAHFRSGERVQLRSRSALPGFGRRLRVQGPLRPGRGPRNFHAFDERHFLAAHAAAAVLEAKRIVVLPGHGGRAWQRDLVEPVRTTLATELASTLARDEASILTALVLGIDDSIDPAVQETWRGLGMTHVLAVSGMHVSLVATALLAITGTPRRRRGLCALLGGLALYTALAGLAPSVLRAAVMAAWAAVALHLGRPVHGIGALGLASVTLLASVPALRHDLGFQLSCAATLGILVWAAPLQALGRRLAARRGGKVAAFCLTSIGLGLAAQLATLPIVYARFGYLSRAAPLADLALVPLANAALVLGLAGAPLALVAPSLARPLWLLAGALLHVTLALADVVMRAGDPRWFLPTQPVALVLATLATIATLAAGVQVGKGRWRAGVFSQSGAAFAFAALAFVSARPPAPAWRLEALDVGQGDALLLSLGKDAWLVDAGDARPVDQGERVILPHLRRLGLRRLRGLFLTHPHRDHCGGAASVLAGFPVDTLYLAQASAEDPTYAPLRAHGTPVRLLHAGSHITLGPRYEAQVLWPPAVDSLRSGANGQSLVLWARGAALPQLLAMGDLEADGEALLLQRAAPALTGEAADFLVLKAGHHGSRTSSTPAFLEAIDAEVALVSVGESNRYGHPATATLAALEARDCRVLRTDRGGAIRLLLRGKTLWLERPDARPAAIDASASAP